MGEAHRYKMLSLFRTHGDQFLHRFKHQYHHRPNNRHPNSRQCKTRKPSLTNILLILLQLRSRLYM